MLVVCPIVRRTGESRAADLGPAVVVVEEDELRRAGRVAVASDALGLSVEGWSIDDALGEQRPVAPVAIVVVTWSERSWDHYPAIDALRSVASHLPPAATLIAVVPTGSSPLVRLRASSAGAGTVVESEQVASVAGWVDLVRTGRRAGRGGAPRRQAGAAREVLLNPNAALEYVSARRLETVFADRQTQSASGVSRRRAMQIRDDLARIGGVRPSSGRSQGGRYRDLSRPTWREVRAFLDEARGADA